MITRIVSYLFLGLLFFSFFLAIVGVTHISTGDEYYSFLGSVSQRFESWKIEIPNIPNVPRMNDGSAGDGDNIFKAFRMFVNFFVEVINAIIGILNIVILVVNIVIQLIQFICTFLFSMKDFIGRLKDLNLARTIV